MNAFFLPPDSQYPFSLSACPGHPYPSPENNQTLQGMLLLKSVKTIFIQRPVLAAGLTCVTFWLGWLTSTVWSSSLTSWVSSCLASLTSWSVDTTWIHNMSVCLSARINLTVVSVRVESNYWIFLNERMGIERHSVECFFSILPGFQQWLQSERLEFPYPAPEEKDYEKGFCKGISLAWSRSPVG